MYRLKKQSFEGAQTLLKEHYIANRNDTPRVYAAGVNNRIRQYRQTFSKLFDEDRMTTGCGVLEVSVVSHSR